MNKIKRITVLLAAAFSLLTASAAPLRGASTDITVKKQPVAADSISIQNNVYPEPVRESIFPEGSKALGVFSHFTWGVDLGASIDLGGNNISTFDADAILGYKNKFFRTIGIGAGVHRAFGSGNNLIPVYAIFRSSFRTAPSLFFFNLKAGYSFNSVKESSVKGGINFSVGVGINLAVSKRFMSHIILSYGHFFLNERGGIRAADDFPSHISQAQIRFGVNF